MNIPKRASCHHFKRASGVAGADCNAKTPPNNNVNPAKAGLKTRVMNIFFILLASRMDFTAHSSTPKSQKTS
jgi:hypothetical protein